MTAQTWIIAGSLRGIVAPWVEAVLAAGHKLMATACDPETLDYLVIRFGDRICAARLNVRDAIEADAAVRAAIQASGRIDVVGNIAGPGDIGSVEDTIIENMRSRILWNGKLTAAKG